MWHINLLSFTIAIVKRGTVDMYVIPNFPNNLPDILVCMVYIGDELPPERGPRETEDAPKPN